MARAVPALAFLFTFLFAIEPALLGSAGESVVPPLRWAVVVASCLLLPLSSARGVARGWTILLFLAVVAFTISFNQGVSSSFPIFARIVGAGSLAMFAGSLQSTRQLQVARAMMFACASVVVGSVLFGVVMPTSAYRLIGVDRDRLYGVTPHPGMLGYLAALVATWFTIGAVSSQRKLAGRLRDATVAIVAVAATFLADSRTSQLATAIALTAVFGIVRLARLRLLNRSIILPWFLLSAAMLAAVAIPIVIAVGGVEISVASDRYATSTLGRVEIWQMGLEAFENNPIVGNGLGSSFRASSMRADLDSLFYFHTVGINYLAKCGLVGGLALLTLLMASTWACFAGAREVARSRFLDVQSRTLFSYAAGGVIVTIIFSITEAALQNLYPSFLVLFLAITLAPRKKA